MSEFDLTIIHVPAKANIVLDALSRRADLDPARVAAVFISVESDLLNTIRLAQEQNSLDAFWDLKFHAIVNDRGMYMHDELVCRTLYTGGQTIVAPDDKALKKCILALYHDSRLGGHLGPYQIIGSLSSCCYWPRMAIDIRNYCKQC